MAQRPTMWWWAAATAGPTPALSTGSCGFPPSLSWSTSRKPKPSRRARSTSSPSSSTAASCMTSWWSAADPAPPADLS
ncbi:hypothetical protein HaLaN_10380, partial [Haematococcus lacustris]